MCSLTANDDTPYRDVLVYINGVFQWARPNNRNITLDQGDDLAIVVRGVGNISTINTDDPRFICRTNIACNMSLSSNVSNHMLECYLCTPAEPNDNGTVTFIVNDTEEIQITITGK